MLVEYSVENISQMYVLLVISFAIYGVSNPKPPRLSFYRGILCIYYDNNHVYMYTHNAPTICDNVYDVMRILIAQRNGGKWYQNRYSSCHVLCQCHVLYRFLWNLSAVISMWGPAPINLNWFEIKCSVYVFSNANQSTNNRLVVKCHGIIRAIVRLNLLTCVTVTRHWVNLSGLTITLWSDHWEYDYMRDVIFMKSNEWLPP